MTADLYSQLTSPVVHSDRRVTFAVRAPEAKTVLLKGLLGKGSLPLHRGTDGVWTMTTEPLAPDLYSYLFEIDGADQLDLHNRDVKKWLSLENQFEVPGDPPLLHEATNVPHGVLHQHWYHSKTTGSQRRVFVYTPPSYNQESPDYPALYLLHGYGDDESAWLEVGRAQFIVDNLLARRKIRPLVVVMPSGHPLKLDRTQPFDDYADRNVKWMEQDLLNDLEPFVQQSYRISRERSQRAIAGLSMGGGQSLTIGLNHVDHFAHVGAFSAAAPQGSIFDQLAVWSLPQDGLRERLPNLWIACGVDDFLLERNRTFHRQLDERKIPHHYLETVGDHSWFVWRKYLAEYLERTFPASGP